MPDSAILSRVGSSELAQSTATMMANTVRHIVDRPDDVAMKMQTDGRTGSIIIYVDPDDIGKVIGKQGRIARSLRVLLSSISSKTGVHFELDIQTNR